MEVGVMPKELIRDAITDGFRAQVGWGGIAGEDSGYVQVSTVNENSTLHLDDPLPEGASALPFDGWYVHLDRAGINRMIRALRRARDSAYGADA
jgi:hypothetical protein